jgi:hypothetical protein
MPRQRGKEGRLMPLVRYEIGDYAVAAEGICGCGRTLPVSPETETWIRAKFCEALGIQVVVAFDRVSEIARTPAGKFMPARSELCETTARIHS